MDKDIIELRFGDETLPVKFGFNAIEEIFSEGIDQFNKGGFENFRKVLFIGLKHGFDAKGMEDFKLTEKDVGNLIDSGPESTKKAWKTFKEAAKLFLDLFKDDEEE